MSTNHSKRGPKSESYGNNQLVAFKARVEKEDLGIANLRKNNLSACVSFQLVRFECEKFREPKQTALEPDFYNWKIVLRVYNEFATYRIRNQSIIDTGSRSAKNFLNAHGITHCF